MPVYNLPQKQGTRFSRLSLWNAFVFLKMDPLSLFLIKEFEQSHASIFQSSSSTEKSFPWNDLISFISEHKSSLSEKITLKHFTEYIIQLLLDYDCSDLGVVSQLMELYYISRDEFFVYYYCNLLVLNYESRIPVALENFLKWSRVSENILLRACGSNRMIHTVNCLKFGDLTFMKFLCKYGFTSVSKASFHPHLYFDPAASSTLFKFL